MNADLIPELETDFIVNNEGGFGACTVARGSDVHVLLRAVITMLMLLPHIRKCRLAKMALV